MESRLPARCFPDKTEEDHFHLDVQTGPGNVFLGPSQSLRGGGGPRGIRAREGS